MVQLQLGGPIAHARQATDKVHCTQRTRLGIFLGTMEKTEDGYMGHIIGPKHPMLPDAAGNGCGKVGFLHRVQHLAYEELVLRVAKAAWNGTLGFEATCIDGCGQSVKDKFESWLIDQICDMRASVFYKLPDQADERRATATRIKSSVVEDRKAFLQQASLSRVNGSVEPQ